ncbi:MAG: threonine synthase [Acidobacteriota bacterium]
MTFISTRAPQGPHYSLAEALRLGPAPDGGLFMPARIEPLGTDFFSRLPGRPLADLAVDVLGHLLPGEIDSDDLQTLAADALDFEIPLVEVAPGLSVLELFHGPTLAFKDVGARFLARLLALTQPAGRRATVLVATSGDTGGAVAQAFFGIDGVDVAILYPEGKVSPLQERQFTTLGGNVRAFAVDGVFDDCQRLVKEAFADRDLAAEFGLTSANSINVGRLLPQSIYYFHAAAQVDHDGPLLFSTPSGNFGNLTAGLLARHLGLNARFIAATNANDVVPQYLETGRFEPRASLRTLSNAMDVGHPNNFERILHLYGGDWSAIADDVVGFRCDDDTTRDTIRRIASRYDYVLDPHTAVGWRAAESLIDGRSESGALILGTAHPAKFSDLVEPILENSIELPERLARHLDKPVLSADIEPTLDALKGGLRG